MLGSVPSKNVAFGSDAEAALDGFLDSFNSDVLSAFAADGKIVMLALTVEMNGEGEVLRRREFRQATLEFQRIGAEVDVLLARDEAVDDLDNLRMQQGLAAGDATPWARRTLPPRRSTPQA